MYALMGAYCEEGAEWTDELREVLGENVTYACDFIEAHFPGSGARNMELRSMKCRPKDMK